MKLSIPQQDRKQINPKVWVYDIETFFNLFTVVFYNPYNDETKSFCIHDICEVEDGELESNLHGLKAFMKKYKPTLIGYNNLNFDGQVLEHILNGKIFTAREIYAFAQETIDRQKVDRWDVEYKEWHKKITELDLMSINHFGLGTAKTTSLKWLMFTMRMSSMDDLPFDHTLELTRENQIAAVLKYNKKDVIVTTEFYFRCQEEIDLRKGLYSDFREKRMINMSEPSIASYMIKDILSKEYKTTPKKLSQRKTYRDQIVIEDIISDKINFINPEFNEVLEFFKSKTLVADKETNLISLKGKDVLGFSMEFNGLIYEYGAGGLHACCEPQIFEATEDMSIVDLDFASFYPFLIMMLDIYPEHLDTKFVDIMSTLYKERKKYAKGTIKNKALKIVLNSIYGLFNNVYSPVYDPKCTVQTTINGQLILSMLVDRFSSIGQVIQVNTDGLTLYMKNKDLALLRRSCRNFEKSTDLILEEVMYSKMIIRDVNNYISVGVDGDVKRKGFFEMYADIKKGNYHKNPSAAIIPFALNEYFVNGHPIEETINSHKNIHDFLFGIKKKSNFEYMGFLCEDNVVDKFDRFEGRVLRYYASTDGYSMFKHFNDGRKNFLQAVSKGLQVKPLQNIRSMGMDYVSGAKKGLSKYPDLNREYYIQECYKTIQILENNE